MPPFLFRCPRTGLTVQGFVADDVSQDDDDVIVQVTCHACGGVHLVNPKDEDANDRE